MGDLRRHRGLVRSSGPPSLKRILGPIVRGVLLGIWNSLLSPLVGSGSQYTPVPGGPEKLELAVRALRPVQSGFPWFFVPRFAPGCIFMFCYAGILIPGLK